MSTRGAGASTCRRLAALISLTLVALLPLSVSQAADSGVLWRAGNFCSRATIWNPVGWCPQNGAWDVTACVSAPDGGEVWSLQSLVDRNRLGGIGRFEVRQGDKGALTGGDRCEIIQQTRAVTGMDPAAGRPPMQGGEERLFRFQARYDASMQKPTLWEFQTVGQWHSSATPSGCPTSSPIRIAITGVPGAKRLDVVAQECRLGVTYPLKLLYSTRLVTDVWQTWAFEVKWSADPNVGFVRISHQGREILPKDCRPDGRCMMATQYSGGDGAVVRNHFKLGNYRDPLIVVPTVVSYRSVSIGLPVEPTR